MAAEKQKAALDRLESYEKDGDELQNWCRVVQARELLSEALEEGEAQ